MQLCCSPIHSLLLADMASVYLKRPLHILSRSLMRTAGVKTCTHSDSFYLLRKTTFKESASALQCRRFSSAKHIDGVHPNASDFKTFYRFNQITYARLLSRMKLYQTGFCVTALPPMTYLSYIGAFPWENTYSACGVAGFACVVLFAMTGYLRRLIGIMSLNEKTNTVKVSHLTFWGGRHDLYLGVEDIVPL